MASVRDSAAGCLVQHNDVCELLACWVMDPIAFWASVAKVQTMADGGLRFVLDAPEGALEAMAALAYAQANGIVLDVTCKPRESDGSGKGRKLHI